MNKNSYTRKISTKEREFKNELIKLDNARVGKLIKDKENAATSKSRALRWVIGAMIVYLLIYLALFFVKQAFYENLIIGAIFPFLFGAFFYFAAEVDGYRKEISECNNEIFNIGRKLYASGNLNEWYKKDFEELIK